MVEASPLKIIELTAENVKRITAVNIKPAGNLVEISGRNGQGKSSVLDSIWWALAGGSNIQKAPIRKGAAEARIKLDLGTVKVTRTFKKKDDDSSDFSTTIVVENEDGARFPSPQKMLDALVGELSFDPLAFDRMEPREQFETLKRFVPGFDFVADRKVFDDDFRARTDVSRRAKELRAQVAGIAFPKDAPADRVDDAALVADLERAGEHNAELERRRARREQAVGEISRQTEIAASYRLNAKALRAQADEEDREANDHEASVVGLNDKLSAAPPLPEQIDTTAVRDRISAARIANEKFDAAARAQGDHARLSTAAKQAEDQAAALTVALDKRKADRLAAIAAAKMPVEGIEFGDGEILLNGVPFDQGSDAERLRASIAIAMASNPRLRIVRVRDGSLLDDDAMRLLAEMAQDRDYQVWIETVGSGGRTAVVIEDGAVKAGEQPQLFAAE